MITFTQLQEKLSDKEYKEVDALLNRDTLLRGNLIKNPTQRQKFASMSGRDTFRRLKRNEDGKLRIDRGTEKKIKVNTQTVSKNFPKLSEGAMAIPAAAGVASKVLPAAAATVGAIGTFLQAKKKGKDLIKPKKGEAKKTKKLIDKYKKTAKVIKPKEGEIAKQRELLSKLEKRVTKPKKGEKKEASKTVKNF